MTSQDETLYKCRGCGSAFPGLESAIEEFAKNGFYCPACQVVDEQADFNKIMGKDNDLFKGENK